MNRRVVYLRAHFNLAKSRIFFTPTDPADDKTDLCCTLQLLRELQVNRLTFPHPSGGGTRGYPVWFRRQEVAR